MEDTRILSEANVDYVLSKLLPDEYIQLEYVECSGDQYIEIDYYPNNLTGIDASVELLDKTLTNAIFSSRSYTSTTLNTFSLFWLSNTNFRMDWNNKQRELKPNSNGNVSININKNVTRLQDSIHTFTNDTFVSDGNPLWLFASQNNKVVTNYAKLKLYYLSIFENDVLLNYFIPCKHRDKIGIYDIITHVFLTSATNSELIGGPEVGLFHIPDDYIFIDHINNGENGSYIDTEIKLNGNSRVVSRTKKITDVTNATAMYGGRDTSSGSYGKALLTLYTVDNWRFDYGTKRSTFSNVGYDSDLYIDFDGGKTSPSLRFSVNTTTLSKQTFDSPSNFFIFCLGQGTNSSAAYKINGRFYFMRLYKDGVLVRNFWPVKRKSDNKLGIFDVENQKFYTNTTGPNFTCDIETNQNIIQEKQSENIGSNTKPALIEYVAKKLEKPIKTDSLTNSKLISASTLKYIINNI